MDDNDPLRKYVEAGIALTQLTRAKAEAIVKELVRAGEVQREQTQDRVEELLDRSRKTTEGVVGVVRREMAEQLAAMGFATRDDLKKLEDRLAAVERRLDETTAPPKAAAPRKAAPEKAATKKAAAKKPPAARKAAAAPPPGTAARSGAAAELPGRRRSRPRAGGPDAG